MTDGIIRLIDKVSGNGSAGPQTENQILRFASRPNDDRGRKTLVLLIHLLEVTATARGEDILARRQAGEGKNSFRISDFYAARIPGVGIIERIRRIQCKGRARERLPGDCVTDSAFDSKRAWRGRGWRRSRRHMGLLKECH